MEKLNVKTTALTLAVVGGVLSLACAAVVALWPAGSLKFFNAMFHGIDLATIARFAHLSAGSVLLGLVEVMVIGAIAGALFAWLYNYFSEKIK